MIRRLEEVKKEYNEECKKVLKKAIDNVNNMIKPITKTIKLETVNGVIPYIPSLPRTRFYHETPINVSGTTEPVLKYKPLLTNSKQIDVHFYKDTTIYDEPYTKNTEILIRLINKTITESEGTLNQKLKEVSDFFDIDFDDMKKFYDDMKSKQKKIIKNVDFDFKSFSKYFCSICCLFGCKVHKISSDSCFNQVSTSCYCNKLGRPITVISDKEINLDQQIIHKVYKMYNYDKCLASYDIFVNYNKNVSCDYILFTIGKSKQRIKTVGISKYKFKGNNKNLFNICSHSGACSDNTFCECFVNNTGCDLRCLCTDCDFMFIGCSCKKGCDLRCRCSRLNKECSIYCKCTKCENILVTKSVPKKTYVYPSTVAGYGCFAGESIKQGEFVIEYVGEIIDKDEGQRRSNFYDAKKVSYLFDYSFENKTGFIDANYIGNNSRFINHSKCPNIYSKIVEVDKIRRICFFALRDIKIGEELFFDYNYKNEIKEMFGLVD
ncbi:hypothetical protein P3W45_001321 [Vairimorpha bombi]|jgi:hypothetical protein